MVHEDHPEGGQTEDGRVGCGLGDGGEGARLEHSVIHSEVIVVGLRVVPLV